MCVWGADWLEGVEPKPSLCRKPAPGWRQRKFRPVLWRHESSSSVDEANRKPPSMTHDVTGQVGTSSDVTQAQAFYIEMALTQLALCSTRTSANSLFSWLVLIMIRSLLSSCAFSHLCPRFYPFCISCRFLFPTFTSSLVSTYSHAQKSGTFFEPVPLNRRQYY